MIVINELVKDKLLIDKRIKESLQYLRDTDYYYARFSETGDQIPDAVVIKRKEARDFIRDHE